jgi:hypothetical protein
MTDSNAERKYQSRHVTAAVLALPARSSDSQTDKQTLYWTDIQTDTWTDRQTDRQNPPLPPLEYFPWGGAPGGVGLPADLSDRQTDRQTDSDRLGLADSDRLGSWTDSDGLPVTGPPGRRTFRNMIL